MFNLKYGPVGTARNAFFLAGSGKFKRLCKMSLMQT
jgi:hypothetical protein